jgi:hypothetical protein
VEACHCDALQISKTWCMATPVVVEIYQTRIKTLQDLCCKHCDRCEHSVKGSRQLSNGREVMHVAATKRTSIAEVPGNIALWSGKRNFIHLHSRARVFCWHVTVAVYHAITLVMMMTAFQKCNQRGWGLTDLTHSYKLCSSSASTCIAT